MLNVSCIECPLMKKQYSILNIFLKIDENIGLEMQLQKAFDHIGLQ